MYTAGRASNKARRLLDHAQFQRPMHRHYRRGGWLGSSADDSLSACPRQRGGAGPRWRRAASPAEQHDSAPRRHADDGSVRRDQPAVLRGRHRSSHYPLWRRRCADQQRGHCPPQCLCRHPGGCAAPGYGCELLWRSALHACGYCQPAPAARHGDCHFQRGGVFAADRAHRLRGKQARTEVQDDGVDVLIVCPSFIDTGIDRAALGADGQPAAHARKTTGATTQPAEVATAILHAAQHQRQLLLFSFTAKAAWWLSRLWPTRYAAIMRKRLRAEIFPATTHASVETTP